MGVITMPDKPAGRGHKIQYSPVKQYALEQNLPLLQPEKLKDEVLWKRCVNGKRFADCSCFSYVAGSGMEMPRLGTFNFMLLYFLNTVELLLSTGRLSTVIRKPGLRLLFEA